MTACGQALDTSIQNYGLSCVRNGFRIRLRKQVQARHRRWFCIGAQGDAELRGVNGCANQATADQHRDAASTTPLSSNATTWLTPSDKLSGIGTNKLGARLFATLKRILASASAACQGTESCPKARQNGINIANNALFAF